MDLPERAIKSLKNTDTEKLSSSALQKAKVLGWETGLGPVMNALPGVFGQQAVLYFPGRSGKYSFPCGEYNGRILLALSSSELESLKDLLLQSPGVEVWLKSGWFAGTVRLLSEEEMAAVTEGVSDEQFFGSAGNVISKHSLKDCKLLEINRSAPCTGTNGPGHKAWVWPLAAAALLLTRKKK